MPTFLTRRFCLLILLSVPALAQAPDERSELERKVDDSRVEFQFLSTPIGKVVEYLARRTELPIRLSRQASSDARVTFAGRDVPLRRALRWTSYLAGLDYFVDEREVLVGTAAEIEARRVVLRTFDVRDLAFGASDSPGPDFRLDAPDEGGLGAAFGGVADESPISTDLLATLLEENFESGTWDAPYSISARRGVLFARHRPEVLERIATFLDELRRMASALVTVEARLLSLGPAEWERSFRRAEGADATMVLDAATWEAVRSRLESAEDVVRLAELRTTGSPGQRVHAIEGEWKTYVKDFDSQVAQGAGVADSIVGILRDGTMIDVRPVPSGDGKSVSIDLVARAVRGDLSRSVPYGPEDARPEGSRAPPIDLPTADALSLLTRVRVPDRGAFVATFVNAMTGEARDRRLVLVVEPRLEETEGGR